MKRERERKRGQEEISIKIGAFCFVVQARLGGRERVPSEDHLRTRGDIVCKDAS